MRRPADNRVSARLIAESAAAPHTALVGVRIAGKLVAAMSESSGRLGRMAAHPVGAALCLALGYAVLCSAYVLFSGRITAGAPASVDELRRLELLNGLVFVVLTGGAYFGFAALLLQRIATQQQHLALIFHGVSDCLFLARIEADGACRFVCVNETFLGVSGLDREHVIGRRIEELLPAVSQAQVLGKCQEAVRERRTVRWEGSAAYPAGLRVGEVTLTPLADKAGTFVQLAGVVRDITERKRAEDEVRELSAHLLRSQDEERQRIGRELHDATGQELVAVAMNLGLVQERGAGHDATAGTLLADSQAILEHCQRELRTLSYQLHPPMLDAAGLAGVVREYADGFTRRSGIQLTLDISPALGRLPADTERALFRVVQECLGNIHRHSGSPTATIRMAREGSNVVLEVVDQGRGMQLRADGTVAKVGVGLSGMRERVRQLGGTFEIESSPRGTTVRAVVPGATERGQGHANPDCR